MAEVMTSQAASLQITPYVDKFFIQRDKNFDGALSFAEFLGDGQSLPTGTNDSATTTTSPTSAQTAAPDIQSVLNDMQSALLQLQELYGNEAQSGATSQSTAITSDSTSTSSQSPSSSDRLVPVSAEASTDPVSASDSSATSAASNGTTDTNPLFKLIDANGDGVVAYQELQAFAVGQLTSGHATVDQIKSLFDSISSTADLSASSSSSTSPTSRSSDAVDTSQSLSNGAQDSTSNVSPTVSVVDVTTGASTTSATGSTEGSDPTKLFSQIDGNQDGEIDLAELRNFTDQKFTQIRSDLDQLASLLSTTA